MPLRTPALADTIPTGRIELALHWCQHRTRTHTAIKQILNENSTEKRTYRRPRAVPAGPTLALLVRGARNASGGAVERARTWLEGVGNLNFSNGSRNAHDGEGRKDGEDREFHCGC